MNTALRGFLLRLLLPVRAELSLGVMHGAVQTMRVGRAGEIKGRVHVRRRAALRGRGTWMSFGTLVGGWGGAQRGVAGNVESAMRSGVSLSPRCVHGNGMGSCLPDV